METDSMRPRPISLMRRTTPAPILRDAFTAISHVILTPKLSKSRLSANTFSLLRRQELIWKIPTLAPAAKHFPTLRTDLHTHENTVLEKETKKSCDPDELYFEYAVKDLKERLERTICGYQMDRKGKNGSPATNSTSGGQTSSHTGFLLSRKARSKTVKTPYKPAKFALLSMQRIRKEMKSLTRLRDKRYQKAVESAIRTYNLQEFEEDEPKLANKTLNAFTAEFT